MRRKLYRAISIIIVLSLFVISIPADAFASDLPSEIFEESPLDAETEDNFPVDEDTIDVSESDGGNTGSQADDDISGDDLAFSEQEESLDDTVISETEDIFVYETESELISGDFKYVDLEDDTVSITGYIGSSASVVIPKSIGGKTVSSIGRFAFKDNKEITGISFATNSGVSEIGYAAFWSCSNLSRVVLPNSLISIGEYAFYECAIKSIDIPNGVTTIGKSAFYFCPLCPVDTGKLYNKVLFKRWNQ